MTKHLYILLLIIALSSCTNAKNYSKLENHEASSLSTPVYITQFGHRYHKKECRTIKYHDVKVVEKEEAISIGRTQCQKCFP